MAPLGGLTHRTIDASGCLFQESSAVWRCRYARGRSSACDLIARPKVPSQSCPDARPARAIPRVSHGRTAVPSMADQFAVVGGVDTHTDFHQAAVRSAVRPRSCSIRASRSGAGSTRWVGDTEARGLGQRWDMGEFRDASAADQHDLRREGPAERSSAGCLMR